ncbi:Histone-lysine N-methyltransferase [Trichostrongylus colubriformis]|uniref:Histone-lysine N-methyltransferase n=1 Tax=Trichostrongylus colubriformis TaxID=6319 RepID=A0AAN8J394_TRICO
MIFRISEQTRHESARQMSYEAVPCMFRSSTQNGNGETQYLGLLIRPSASQPNQPPGTPSAQIVGRTSNGQPGTPTANCSKGPQPLLVQGVYPQGGPIVVQGETPKVLVPAKVQVRLQQGGDASVAISPTAIPSSTLPMATSTMGWSQTATMKTAFAPSGHNVMSSPCNSQHRSLSVCSASPQLDSSPMSPLPNIIQYHNHATPATTRVGLQADPRSTRVTAAGQWAAPVSDSSTTPDSGIQSVPGSPPSSHPLTPPTMQLEGCDSVCEERCDNDEDFADMPRLLPVDQEEAQCSISCLSVREDVASSHGSECETAPTPSISITPTMDSKDIVEQLLMLDPEKANAIANLIKRRQNNKRRSSSKQEMAPKRGRPTSSASEDLKKSEEEPTPTTRVSTRSTSRASQKDSSRVPSSNVTKLNVSPSCVDDSKEIGSQEISPVPSEQVCSESPSSEERRSSSGAQSYDVEMRKLYREAIKRMLKEKLASLLEATVVDMQGLHIGLRERHDRRHSRERKNLWTVNWEQVRKRRRKADERKRACERKREVPKNKDKDHPKWEPREKSSDADVSRVEPTVERRSRKRRNDSLEKEKDEPRIRSAHSTPAKRVGCCNTPPHPSKREKEYEEISRSVGVGSLPEWDSPVLSCGCTRGACTSDSECVNRALCVQCPSACAAPLCANKKFWKDDALKTLVVSGAKTRKVLRTKQARRAGDFLVSTIIIVFNGWFFAESFANVKCISVFAASRFCCAALSHAIPSP